MTKIRKQKVKKKYRYNVNRKRLNKKKLPKLECKTIENAWNIKTSCQKNFKKMGLVYDVNKDIKLSTKKTFNVDSSEKNLVNLETKESSVVAELMENSKVKEPNTIYFSDYETKYLRYLLEKYGNDYKAMVKDRRNYLQLTWRQIKHKINSFQKFLQIS